MIRRPARSDWFPEFERMQFSWGGHEGYVLVVDYDDRKTGINNIITPHLSPEEIKRLISG